MSSNEWKDRIIDGLIVAHIYREEHENDPQQALLDLIQWHCQVECDPLVSSRAAYLAGGGMLMSPVDTPAIEPGLYKYLGGGPRGEAETYLLRGTFQAAGTSKGQPPVVCYQGLNSGYNWYRSIPDFCERMYSVQFHL